MFHKKVAKECEEMFGLAAGMSIDEKPALVDFRMDDSDAILEYEPQIERADLKNEASLISKEQCCAEENIR